MAKSFHELSSRTQLIVFGLLCVVAVAGAWQVSHRAGMRLNSKPAAPISPSSRAKSSACRRSPTNCRSCSARSRRSTVALRETTAAIPEEKDPQDVLRNLHDIASDSSLDIASFKPSAIVAKAQYSEWPIQVGFEGGFHDLGRFFDRLAAMSRLISVTDLEHQDQVEAGRPRHGDRDLPGDDVRVPPRSGGAAPRRRSPRRPCRLQRREDGQ